MNKNTLSLIVAALCCGLSQSCSVDDGGSSNLEGKYTMVVDMLAPQKPVQLTAEQKVFACDNNMFTINFLKTVNQTERSGKSFIFSPLGVTYVLGMVNDAATGDTEKELEQTLGFHEGGIQAVNEYCKNLIDNLPKADENATLDIANAIFLNKQYQLKEQFKKDVEWYYDGRVEALDFSSSNTLEHINSWCRENTNDMIPSILDKVDAEAVSYLLNAIYFKSDWTNKFDPKETKNEAFTTEKGTSTQLPLMHQTVMINYKKNDTYSAVVIPYGNGMWSMTVMLPEKGKTTDDIIDTLASKGFTISYDRYADGAFSPYVVDLKIPRFKTSSDTDALDNGLVGLLQQMGIKLAFDPYAAEITNMANLPVFITEMRQKAAIEVTEEGTEASVITVAESLAMSVADPGLVPKADFHANRPFVYVIREASSGVILCVGKFTGE